MIKEKKFDSILSMNKFVDDNNPIVISIETIIEKITINSQFPNGNLHYRNIEKYKLWYKEII